MILNNNNKKFLFQLLFAIKLIRQMLLELLVHHYIIIAAFIMLYILYLYKCKYFYVKMAGDYNHKLKDIGDTIPQFPNGWYIVCKSKQLKINTLMTQKMLGKNVILYKTQAGKLYAYSSTQKKHTIDLEDPQIVNQKFIKFQSGQVFDIYSGQKQIFQKKLQKKQIQIDMKLKPLHHRQLHGFIYIWTHALDQQPLFQVIDVTKLQSTLSSRGVTVHDIHSHVQDLPENGADVFHFKYVHKYPVKGINQVYFEWHPKWMRGDNPQLPSMFVHQRKNIHEFKQWVYEHFIQNIKNKQYYSFANIDNYIVLPVIGKIFVFNLSVIQMGPGLVYVFFKSEICTLLFIQHVCPKEPFLHTFYHQVYTSGHLPYGVSAIMIYGEAIQVYNDMLIWNSKKFARKLYLRDNIADQFIRNWRGWVSQFYEGCEKQTIDKQQQIKVFGK